MKVDYILTHCCSSKTLEIVSHYCGFKGNYEIDTLNKYFDSIQTDIKYRHWYFGHYHEDILDVFDRQSLLYEKIVEI